MGVRAKLNISIGTSEAGWNLTCFDSNLAFIDGQNASVAKVCESGIRIKTMSNRLIAQGCSNVEVTVDPLEAARESGMFVI